MFEDGVHLATYSSVSELREKSQYYLAHKEKRRRIAACGRQEVLEKHTYLHRVSEMLDAVRAKPAASDRK
jgi:spore maturation protein CgeB